MPQQLYPLIHSIGTANPINKIAQKAHLNVIENTSNLSRAQLLLTKKVYNNSGISYRYSVLDEFDGAPDKQRFIFNTPTDQPVLSVAKRMQLFEKYAPALCKDAVMNCLSQLPDLNKSRITHLITFSCTGMYAPGLDIQLVEQLELPLNVERTCINFMGCYAAINALKSAYHIARSEPDAVVLIAGVELCTLHYRDAEEQDQVVANALFADGAAAAIVSLSPLNGDGRGLCIKNFYSEFDSSGSNEMVWAIGDHGFDLRLSSYVPALIQKSIFTLTEKLLQRAQLKQSDINYYALHPGGVKILSACEAALIITPQQNKLSYEVLNDYGNMSSVTILFVLKKYMQSFTAADKGNKLLACAFGPGLTMESMIAEVC